MRRVSNTVWSLLVLALAFSVLRADDPPPGTQDAKQATKLPKSVDLRPQLKTWGLQPRSQEARNTCSVFVTTAALEFAVSKHFRRGTPLSVEYLNWACNQVIKNQTEDRGQFFHDLLKGYEEHGICLDVNMPYQKKFDPKLKPSEKAIQKGKEIRGLELQVHWINPWKPQPGLTDDHLREIKAVLAKGYPVAAGSSHSRLIVGYVDDARQPGGGLFLTKDSGAAAYNTITFEFAKERVGDVFWVEAPTKPIEKKSSK
jgi:hypothetical protein